MKMLYLIIFIHLTFSCTEKMEVHYTGSTPANGTVRDFLGIPSTDSVDFIRWKLTMANNAYQLNCQYGIGKPNTNGFINGGESVVIKDSYTKERGLYRFRNGPKTLDAAFLNGDLLHVLGKDGRLLVGNGGWSYTLNNIRSSVNNKTGWNRKQPGIKDSAVFEGRTPCTIPGIERQGSCYKLKWLMVLHAPDASGKMGRYSIQSTLWREQGKRTGAWKVVEEIPGNIVYELTDAQGKIFLRLLALDENILVFIDGEGKLLVGNEDFSYTLNRRGY